METLNVNILYESSDVSLIRFDQLVNYKGVIHPDDLDESTFINAYGGLELICNNYLIFFQSNNYYDLFPCIQFLLHSLYSLNIISFNIYGIYSDILTDNQLSKLTDDSGNSLIIEALNVDTLNLSYIKNPDHGIIGRNDFFFKGVVIKKQMWINAVVISLSEYFIIVDRILIKFPNQERKSYLRDLFQKWNEFLGDFESQK